MMSLWHGEVGSHLKLLYKTYAKWAHWYDVHWHTVVALHSYQPYLTQIMVFLVTCGVQMTSLHYGWGWQSTQTTCRIHIRHLQSVWEYWYGVHRHRVATLHSYPPYLSQILGFWVTCGVQMMSFCHGWGSQTPQTTSHIHIRDRGSTRKNVIFSNSLWTNYEYPNLL